MTQAYRSAIDILMQGEVDFRQIAIELAKTDPDLFVRLAEQPRAEPWLKEIIGFVREQKYVESIRTLRTHTRFGLKEAKDVIDNLRERLGFQGWNSAPWEPNRNLDREQEVMLASLLRAAGR